MKRIYVLLPLLGLTAFAGYYHHWISNLDPVAICRRSAGPEPVASWIPEGPFDEYTHRDGKRDAEDDIINGHPKELTYGLPICWIGEYAEVLKKDYDVELEAVAGCCVTEPLCKYVGDYNQVIDGYLRRIHGDDYSQKTVAKAEALYAERHPTPQMPDTKL